MVLIFYRGGVYHLHRIQVEHTSTLANIFNSSAVVSVWEGLFIIEYGLVNLCPIRPYEDPQINLQIRSLFRPADD